MLDMQERIFRNLFESVLSSVNIRIDEIVKSVAEQKASLEYSQQDIDDLWKFTDTLAGMEDELDDIQLRSLKDKEDKIEYLENQSRRNNIRVVGIPEDEHETWSDTETKVKHVLEGKLHLSFEPEIERAHRIGAKPRSGAANSDTRRPRVVVCRLRDWKQKDAILRAARRVKPSGVFFNEDLASLTLEKRKLQMDKYNEARRTGNIAYFVMDRLVIKERKRQEQS